MTATDDIASDPRDELLATAETPSRGAHAAPAQPSATQVTTTLTVLVPTYNEADYIEACLRSIVAGLDGIRAEILVIDGLSDDGTRDIVARLGATDVPFLTLLDNPQVHQVHALNIGIAHAQGDFIVRCDAHSLYPPSYFRDILAFYAADEAGIYGNIGLKYVTETSTTTRLQRGIPLAMSSRIGVGASHRVSETVAHSRPVDTLLFGAWRRQVFDAVGPFDTAFIRGQDYEHNLRVRGSGLKVALIAGAPFTYYTRSSFRKMRRMIYQYAYVKGQLLRKHKLAPNIRSQIPVFFVLGLLVLLLAWPPLGLAVLGAYLLAVAATAALRIPRAGVVPALGMFLAVPQMHLSHAAGFLHGLVSNPRQQSFIRRAGHTR